MITSERTWVDYNREQLVAAVAALRFLLEGHETDEAEPVVVPALDALAGAFGLTPFERDVLALAASTELDGTMPALLAAAHGDSTRPFASFGLALALLPGAHWSALAADAPLRRWHLLEVDRASALSRARLTVDEPILHFLTGLDSADSRLAPYTTTVAVGPEALAPSHVALVQTARRAWDASFPFTGRAVQICGAEREHVLAVARSLAHAAGASRAVLVDPAVLPPPGTELEGLCARLEREAMLTGAPVVVDLWATTTPDPVTRWIVERLLMRTALTVIVVSRSRDDLDHPLLTLDVGVPSLSERVAQWLEVIGPGAEVDDRALQRLAGTFVLDPVSVAGIAVQARAEAAVTGAPLLGALWRASRLRRRAELGGRAALLEPRATWADLVLPADELARLHDIARQARNRAVVQEAWGFGATGGRGAGVSVLFAGPSGTGKTLAAEVLAADLEVDLYHVDLSQIVSKYIGETEKNLARVFDAAERGGAVLLFDEADALFGKRTEVKDSHDRYANIEVSYLLQRMESYTGIAILTTNMRASLDPAFVRRLRFIVTFPHPDAGQREGIWKRIFPSRVPLGELDTRRLAQLDVPGGTIRNIALHAAYRAADDGSAVTMAHVRDGARAEYAKLERPLTATELRGWE